MTTQNLRIAATLALNAVEEHLVGSYIDWHDVARVLREALDERKEYDAEKEDAAYGGFGMKNCKIESATILCRNCEMIYGFDVQTTQEGFRITKCPHCGYEQMVWIEFRAIVVPVPTRY